MSHNNCLPIIALFSILITSCNPPVTHQVTTIPKPISTTITITSEITSTITPSLTATIMNVWSDPYVLETWPIWAQEFFIKQPEDSSQDVIFQEFIDRIRRNYLQNKNITNLELLTSELLMKEMSKLSAIERRIMVLSPIEIISMMTDYGEWMRPHVDPANGAWYDLFSTFSIIKDITKAPLPSIDEEAFYFYLRYSYLNKMFGRDVQIPTLTAPDMRLDFAGIVRLPGEQNIFGLLLRFIAPKNEIHYRVYRVLNEITTFTESDYCLSGAEDLSIHRKCPYPLEGGGIKIWGWTPETMQGNLDTAPRHQINDLISYLIWPPSSSKIHLLSRMHFINPVVMAVIDPKTGLLVTDFIHIYSPEEFRTSSVY